MGEIRYLVKFSHGGGGMRSGPRRWRSATSSRLRRERYRVVWVEQPPSEAGFGRVRAELEEPSSAG